MDILSQSAIGIIIAVAAVLLVAVILVLIWMIPAKGLESEDYWHSKMKYTNDYAVNLEKQPGKDFKILVLSDIQLNDTIDFFGLKGTAYDTMEKLITEQKPDMILFMGDTIWSTYAKVSTIQFVKFIDKFKIPWAAIFGNHESETNVDLNWIADKFMKSEYCIMKKGPNNIGGVGNYVVNITENDKVVESLIMVDSHSSRKMYPELGEGGYDFIYDSQINWYKWIVEGLKAENGGENVDSMLFIHIPLCEYKNAVEQYGVKGKDDVYKVPKEYGFGENREGIGCAKVNSGMFDVIKDLESTKYVFAAHDHINNSSINYEGIQLTYTLKTGDRCYANEDMNGGTLITIGDHEPIIEHIYC